MIYDLIVMGGGAAGFFGAIQFAARKPRARILILEKSGKVLSKVKISGGGRCNVTHACFEPREMVKHYPRGEKELLGPFHHFLCGDMMGWLADHGVDTHIEEDGRVFPTSNSSQTIIDCFQGFCMQHGIKVLTGHAVTTFTQRHQFWTLETASGSFDAKQVLIATGSSPAVWKMLGKMGYEIVPPVPSLFTFNIKDALLKNLPGVSVPKAKVSIQQTGFEASGPLLITHWGLSGPAVLRLSAWAARELGALRYRFFISVNWVGEERSDVLATIQHTRKTQGKKQVQNLPLYQLPKRLWLRMVQILALESLNYASLNAKQIEALATCLTASRLSVTGKSTFKDEFVTCGGVDNKQIHFKTMESKLHPNLYFAGEVLNIDAITGGFNFQAAWTTAYIAAASMAKNEG